MEKSLKRLQEADRQLELQKLEAERLIEEGRQAVRAVEAEKVKPLMPPNDSGAPTRGRLSSAVTRLPRE